VVEAFEAQLEAERQANDLDYDEAGRLRFSAVELAEEVGDAKGGAAAPRMKYSRRRHYGDQPHRRPRAPDRRAAAAHRRLCRGNRRAPRRAGGLHRRQPVAQSGPDPRAEANLATTAAAIALLAERAAASRAGFGELPRLEIDNGREPEPVAHEDLAA
jgi:MoxR-like ATPase